MKHGFIKLAAAVPETHVAAPMKNACEIISLMDEAYQKGVHVLVFPELSLTGYTCGDLFHTDELLSGAERALCAVAEHSRGMKMLVVLGVPIRSGDGLYNCAVALSDGEILSVTPKTAVPNYGEFYEARHFTPGGHPVEFTIRGDRGTVTVPSSHGSLLVCREMPSLAVGCEICEDMWTTGSPSETLAESGATVLCNLSASNETVGKDEYRRTLVRAASGKCAAAYIYCDAGEWESTTDLVFSGHSMIAVNGTILSENEPFGGKRLITTVADLDHLRHDRMRMNTWKGTEAKAIPFSLDLRDTDITGQINPTPFIPAMGEAEDSVCRRILDIQAAGLAKRIRAAHASACVIGLSGGLDSTLALIVTAEAMKRLGRGTEDIIALTMPCFGTTSRTRSNAEMLGELFGTRFRTIDIKESVDLHFRDIGHDPSDRSVVYENTQARERTQILMDIANAENGLVIGTGDLSELALGWATYNGDHMSNYGVNGGVPKTLVRVLVGYYARVHGEEWRSKENGSRSLGDVLRDILDTPVSPELLPPEDGDIAQKTEDLVGPYVLHDFFLYHYVRWGESREKILREALSAFAGTFGEDTISKWLTIFTRRFRIQQFKRSALPDGPKVGSVALSPRGDWRMPSDAEADD